MKIKAEKLQMRIIILLKTHILEDISIREFWELTNALKLSEINTKLRDGIIEYYGKKQRGDEANREFDLLEAMEEEQ